MRTSRVYFLFVLVCGIFGTTFLAISMGLKAGASPLLFAAFRFILAGFILLALLGASGKISMASTRALAPRAALLSLFLTVGTFGCMFIAQTKVDSGFMARLDATGPLFTALFAALFLGKRLTPIHAVAFGLGTLGTFLIAGVSIQGSAGDYADIVYVLAAMGSVIFYAAGNVLYPLLFPRDENPIAISALQAFIGGFILLIAALLFEDLIFPMTALGPLLWLTVAGSVIAHTAMLILIRDAGPIFASGWLYIAPIVATFAGFLVLGEGLTLAGLIGTILALAAIFIMDRAEVAL